MTESHAFSHEVSAFIHIYIYIYIYWFEGKNGQIPLFFEIISEKSLFEKYLAMYHFYKTRV